MQLPLRRCAGNIGVDRGRIDKRLGIGVFRVPPDQQKNAKPTLRWRGCRELGRLLNTGISGSSCVLDNEECQPVRKQVAFSMANTYAPLQPVVPRLSPATGRRCLMSIKWDSLCRMVNMIFGEFTSVLKKSASS